MACTIKKGFVLIVLSMFMIVGSLRAELWGDRVESKIDVIDSEISIIETLLNNGTTYLTSADIVTGNISLTSSGNYTLAEELTTDITISGGCITLDLNDHCLTGTIVISSDNVTIKNGTLLSPAGAGGGSIAVESTSDKTRISHITIQGSNGISGDAKDGIEVAGDNWIIENCTIITGNGPVFPSSGRGGHGISLLAAASNVLISNCLISTGDGSTTNADGGNGININGSSRIEVADCTIFKTGNGSGGNGGTGIFVASTSTDIAIHNCIIRNTGAGGGGPTTGGKAIDDDVAGGTAATSIVYGNFAHNIANSIKFDLQGSGSEQGFALSNPPTSTAVSVYANVYI